MQKKSKVVDMGEKSKLLIDFSNEELQAELNRREGEMRAQAISKCVKAARDKGYTVEVVEDPPVVKITGPKGILLTTAWVITETQLAALKSFISSLPLIEMSNSITPGKQ